MDASDWDRISKKYFDEIESPFNPDVKNPLKNYLKDIKSNYAIDLGCGIGNLVPLIRKKFSKITCIDFSPGMIAEAKKKHGKYSNVEFLVSDIKDLSDFHNLYDYAFAINSIIEPSIPNVKKSIIEINNVLKPGGKFIGVFPALESDILRALVTFEKKFKKTGCEEKSTNHTHSKISYESYDFLLGMYENDGKQKHYYQIQIEYLLNKAGFRNIKFSKVLYPWTRCMDDELKSHNGDLKLFDWCVRADKIQQIKS